MKCLPNLFTKSFFYKKKRKKNNPFTPQPAGPPRPLLAGVYTGPGGGGGGRNVEGKWGESG